MTTAGRARRMGVLAGLALAGTLLISVTWRTWPRALGPAAKPMFPRVDLCCGRFTVTVPGATLLVPVAVADDELTAYLEFEYLKALRPAARWRVLLERAAGVDHARYRLFLAADLDLLQAVPAAAALRLEGVTSQFGFAFVDQRELERIKEDTQRLVAAYSVPVPVSFRQLPPERLVPQVARFIAFKSRTDRRVRRKIAPVPAPLSAAEALRLSSDIIDVARFYGLPLDYFLGIGAMENNFISVRGDLGHTVWKKSAQQGDVVLNRRRGHVLVLNDSAGVWQITRETLRKAHVLYLKDRRDYSLLPARLRPSGILDVSRVSDETLTTYAGLWFRSLLDFFSGDARQAAAAYNGGVSHPSERYADGVAAVAAEARRAVGRAALRDDRLAARAVPDSRRMSG